MIYIVVIGEEDERRDASNHACKACCPASAFQETFVYQPA
jgi:hypothetical protein